MHGGSPQAPRRRVSAEKQLLVGISLRWHRPSWELTTVSYPHHLLQPFSHHVLRNSCCRRCCLLQDSISLMLLRPRGTGEALTDGYCVMCVARSWYAAAVAGLSSAALHFLSPTCPRRRGRS